MSLLLRCPHWGFPAEVVLRIQCLQVRYRGCVSTVPSFNHLMKKNDINYEASTSAIYIYSPAGSSRDIESFLSIYHIYYRDVQKTERIYYFFFQVWRQIALHTFTQKRFMYMEESPRRMVRSGSTWYVIGQEVADIKLQYSLHCLQKPSTSPYTDLYKSTLHLHMSSQTHYM
jgi:hypothetical protein